MTATSAASVWPRIDLDETDKNYRVTAELPGMEEGDVEVLLPTAACGIKPRTPS
jgi:HSP20 family protein